MRVCHKESQKYQERKVVALEVLAELRNVAMHYLSLSLSVSSSVSVSPTPTPSLARARC